MYNNNHAPQDELEKPSPWNQLMRSLHGRWHWAIALGIVLALLFGVIGRSAVKDQFRSTGMIRLLPSTERVLYEYERNEPIPMFDAYMDSQVRLMQSERVLDLATQDGLWQDVPETENRDLNFALADGLRIFRASRSQVIVVGFESWSPEAAQVGVEAMINAYKLIYDESDAAELTRQLDRLEERRRSLGIEARTLQTRLSETGADMDPELLLRFYEHKAAEMVELEQSLRTVQLQLASLEAAASVESGAGGASAGVPNAALLASDSVYTYMNSQLETAKLEVAALRQRFGDEHREVELAQGRVELLQEAINQRMAQLDSSEGVDGLNLPREVALASLQAEEQSLRELVASTSDSLQELSQRKFQIENLMHQITEVQERLDETEARIETINVESAASGRLEVVSAGQVPGSAFNGTRRTQASILGAMAGMFTG